MATLPASPDAGLDFVRGVARDIKVLQEDVLFLKDLAKELQATVGNDRKASETAVNDLHERISRESAVQTQMRAALEKRADGFEYQTQGWVSQLGKELIATNEHLARSDEAVFELSRQMTASKQRLTELEGSCTRQKEMQAFLDRFNHLSQDVERNRAAATAATEAAAERAAYEAKLLGERLETLAHQTTADKKTLTMDVSNLSAKVESLGAFAATRAKQTDAQAMELRLAEVERTLRRAEEDIAARALATVVNAMSDRLGVLASDVSGNAAKSEATDERLEAELGNVSQSLAKAIRQSETDRGLWTSCCAALETKLAEAATKAEAQGLATRMATAEELLTPLPRTLAGKASTEEVERLLARTAALEDGFAKKAEATVTARLELAVADNTAKCEALQQRSEDFGSRLGRLAGAKQQSDEKLAGLETRANELQDIMGKKPDAGDVHTKASLDEVLREYYRKEETDAQLARVWWRVGDMGKNRVVTPVSHR